MKILVITTQDRFFLTHIQERALFFKQKGWEVAIAAQMTDIKYQQKITSLGFKFYDTKLERSSINPLSQFFALIRLKKIIKNFNPDISYHLGAKAIFYGTFVAKFSKKNIKVVNAPIGLGFVYASSSMKARFLRPVVDLLYKFFLNPPNSKVIIENNDDIEYFIEAGSLNRSDAHCILGAGVDTEKFRPSKKHSGPIVVVMASRLIVEKGVWDFVKMAETLFQEKLPVRCLLIGKPDEGNPSSISINDYERLKSNPSLECLGFCENVSKEFAQADICCFPTFYREGLPRVLIEAASSGLAIITTDVIGCRETVNGRNGLLVQTHDIQAMVEQIRYYVNNPDRLRIAQYESRALAINKFDKHIICQQTYNVFKSLL